MDLLTMPKWLFYSQPSIWSRAQLNKIGQSYVSVWQTKQRLFSSALTLENLNIFKWDTYMQMYTFSFFPCLGPLYIRAHF